MNELIEQIGGRERLEALIDDEDCRVTVAEQELLAKIALAVLDAKPVAVVDIQRGRGDGKKFALCYTSAGHSLPDDVYNLYTTPPAASVPDGYKLAPIEPSKEMLLASKRYKAKTKVPTGPGVYRAMIASAPAPAPGGDGE